MMTRSRSLLLFPALLLLWTGPTRLPAAEPLRIGMAETDITPPEGFPMAGYYHERLATGVKDPLKAKAIVFLGNGRGAALVACDLTGIAVDLTREVRRRAARATGIPPEHIALTGTHSHTAPDYTRDLYLYLKNPSEPAQARYAPRLIEQLVGAIVAAHAAAGPAQVEAGAIAQETPVAFNRRFVMKDGSVKTWMRLDHPDVVRAAGPIDPELGLLLVKSAADQPLGVLSSFALHLDTVGGLLWSADYPYFIEQSVREKLGPKAISIFGTGCCGDINHADPVAKERNKTDFIGGELGKTLQLGLRQLTPVAAPRLNVKHAVVSLPLQEVSASAVAQSQPLVAAAVAGNPPEFLELVTAYKTLMLDQMRNRTPLAQKGVPLTWGLTHTWQGVGGELPVDVQVMTLGDDVALVFLPGEIFVELGLAIKRASPFRTTLVIELANCVETIYVPTRAAYAGGSYEVTNSTTQPGSGEMLVEAAIRLLREAAAENRTQVAQ